MARAESGAPTNDLAVVGFCELWGLILGLPPGEDLYRGAPLTVRMISFLALGAAFAILGPAWPWLKTKFPRRLSTSFVRVASDFRAWMVLLLAFLFYPNGGTIQRQVPAWIVIAVVVLVFGVFEVTDRLFGRGAGQVEKATGEARPTATSERTSTSTVVAESRTDSDALADEDAEIMEQRIHWIRHIEMLPEPKLNGNAPFVKFHQQMINASVLPITFEPEIGGRLRIDGEEQKDRLEFRQTPRQVLDVRRASYHDLVIRQWLTPEAARQMLDRLETVFEFVYTTLRFNFEHRGKKRTIEKALGNQVVWRRLPATPHPVVRLRMWSLDPRVPDSNTAIAYKAKLTFLFTNESGRPIDVLETQFNGVPLQVPVAYAYRVESAQGSWKRSDWGKEDQKISVPAGWTFKLWVGLDPSTPHAELEKKRDKMGLAGCGKTSSGHQYSVFIA